MNLAYGGNGEYWEKDPVAVWTCSKLRLYITCFTRLSQVDLTFLAVLLPQPSKGQDYSHVPLLYLYTLGAWETLKIPLVCASKCHTGRWRLNKGIWCILLSFPFLFMDLKHARQVLYKWAISQPIDQFLNIGTGQEHSLKVMWFLCL